MKKTLIILFSLLAAIAVTVLFVTSTSYIQLVIASLLYPPIAYLIFSGFSIKENTAQPAPINTNNPVMTSPTPPVEVIDFDKRAFLKLVGAAGLSFFVFSFLSKRLEGAIFNKDSSLNSKNETSASASTATDGYKVNEIDSGEISYYGFVNENGEWYIMREDSNTGSFRYTRGKSEFAKNWENRESFDYGYYHKVFGN